MNRIAVLLGLIKGYKTYSAVILAVVSGVGMILTKDYGGGVSEILQALTLAFGGASIAGVRGAVGQLSNPAPAGPSQPAKAN